MKVKKLSENTIEFEGQTYIKKDSIPDSKYLDIPELSTKEYTFQVEINVHDKNKSWKELNLSEREHDLLTYDQCVLLANNPKYSKILKMDGSSRNDDFFVQQPFELNRRSGYIAGFVAGSDLAYLNCWDGSGGHNSSLGVRFVRKKFLASKK
jgi:hypothetical protein